MKPETRQFFEERVLPALRDGQYRQGYGDLYHSGAYCAVGVIANEWMEAHGESLWVRSSGTVGIRHEHDNGLMYMGTLSVRIAEDLGLTPEIEFDRGLDVPGATAPIENLVMLNDAGVEFLEIADTLESLIAEDALIEFSDQYVDLGSLLTVVKVS